MAKFTTKVGCCRHCNEYGGRFNTPCSCGVGTFKRPELLTTLPFNSGDLQEYDGWSNQATHDFNLYFMQERALYEELCKEIFAEDGSIDYMRCANIMIRAYVYQEMMPIPYTSLDDMTQAAVNFKEIADTLAAELRR